MRTIARYGRGSLAVNYTELAVMSARWEVQEGGSKSACAMGRGPLGWYVIVLLPHIVLEGHLRYWMRRCIVGPVMVIEAWVSNGSRPVRDKCAVMPVWSVRSSTLTCCRSDILERWLEDTRNSLSVVLLEGEMLCGHLLQDRIYWERGLRLRILAGLPSYITLPAPICMWEILLLSVLVLDKCALAVGGMR